MVAIKDFEMPKSCFECDISSNGLHCPLTDTRIKTEGFNFLYHRASNCPLVEIKEVEDGKID